MLIQTARTAVRCAWIQRLLVQRNTRLGAINASEASSCKKTTESVQASRNVMRMLQRTLHTLSYIAKNA